MKWTCDALHHTQLTEKSLMIVYYSIFLIVSKYNVLAQEAYTLPPCCKRSRGLNLVHLILKVADTTAITIIQNIRIKLSLL